MPTERAAYQLFWGRVRNRVGVGRKLYEVITFMKSVSRNNYIPIRHEADYCMDLARKIGVVTDNISPEIFLTESEIKESRDFLEGLNIDLESYNIMIHSGSKNSYNIMIHSGSKNSSPNWSEEHYLELIKLLLTKGISKKINIFLTAIEMSNEFISQIKKSDFKNIYFVQEKLNPLRKFISFINCMDLVVVSSTGPAHLADALKKKAVVLHCNRNVNCVKHWGTINGESIDLED